MIPRTIASKVDELLTKHPIVNTISPRQSGKMTLTKMLRPDYEYVSLENPSDRLLHSKTLLGLGDLSK
jgi:hypothetical protein